jgi:hypothetical protein
LRDKLLFLRTLIFEVAWGNGMIWWVEETLKWWEPSYIAKSWSGTTVRINKRKGSKSEYAIYFHCQTHLVSTFRQIYADVFKYEWNRAIIFHKNDEVSIKQLKHCIELALTYKLHKCWEYR